MIYIPLRLLKNFYDDLKAAGIELLSARGERVDLHSLRHTFAQCLNDLGVDLKTMQAMLRHSSASLTLGVCIHKDESKMAKAVTSLHALGTQSLATPINEFTVIRQR